MKVDLKIRIAKSCILSESKRQMNLILDYVLKVMPKSEIAAIEEKGFIIYNSDIDLQKVFRYKYIIVQKANNDYYIEISEKAIESAFSMVDLKYQPDKFRENMTEISRYKKACNGKILKGYFTKEENNQLKKDRRVNKPRDKSQLVYNERRQKGLQKKIKLSKNPLRKNAGLMDGKKHSIKSFGNCTTINRYGNFKPN